MIIHNAGALRRENINDQVKRQACAANLHLRFRICQMLTMLISFEITFL